MRKEDVQSELDIVPENLEKLEILRAMGYEEFASVGRSGRRSVSQKAEEILRHKAKSRKGW